MKVRLLAMVALAFAAQHAAGAQEVTPEAPHGAPPPDAGAPSGEVTPATTEAAPTPAAAAPVPVAPPSLAPPAPAAAAPAFGLEGRLLLSIDLPFMNEGPQFGIVHQSSTMGGLSSTRIVVQPSVDYFVAPRLSIGAQLGIDHVSITLPPLPLGVTAIPTSNGGTTLSIETRVGYDIPIAETVSAWPRLGLGYTHTSTSYAYTYASEVTGYSVPLSFTVPFLWHPGSRFFVGAGPAFVTQLINKSQGASAPKTTDYGITALIGGAIGGD
jgi:hypothetical protein